MSLRNRARFFLWLDLLTLDADSVTPEPMLLTTTFLNALLAYLSSLNDFLWNCILYYPQHRDRMEPTITWWVYTQHCFPYRHVTQIPELELYYYY